MNQLMFIRTLSPMHVGTGRAAGHIDLEIARERCTEWPVVPGSSVKGVLRDAARDKWNNTERVNELFGQEGDDGYSGSVCCGDLRILLFPVRSLYGGFAYVTSPLAIRRFSDMVKQVPNANVSLDDLTSELETSVIVHTESQLTVDVEQVKKCYLEDIDLAAETKDLSALAKAVAAHVSLDANGLKKQLCIVSESVFAFFCKTATEVATKVTLDIAQKTAKDKGLRTEESVPCEAIFYGLIHFQKVKNLKPEKSKRLFGELTISSLQIGGNSTTGQGLCKVGWLA